jgi:aspartate/methionine/tyrosine aminotransferase
MKNHLKRYFLEQDLDVDSQLMGSLQLYYPAGAGDVKLVQKYYGSRPPYEEVLYFSIGETWSQIAPGLKKMFEEGPHPIDGHGYQLYPYGLPELRQTLKKYIQESHKFPHTILEQASIETVVAGQGTRTAMFDFGRVIAENSTSKPVVISTIPGWDYRGIFEPLGFCNEVISLSPHKGFMPQFEDYEEKASQIKKSGDFELSIVTINAQHNPTGNNWSSETVRKIIRLAAEHHAAILLDDAYYAIHNDGVHPTSALAILLDEFYGNGQKTAPVPWLAVRSLGKQFNSNGWSLGCITGEFPLIRRMMNKMLYSRSYPYGTMLQHIMNRWLLSPESDLFLKTQHHGYLEKRRLIGSYFTEYLGYPHEALHLGECTSYALVKIPPSYHHLGSDRFRADCFARTGVLLGLASLNVDGKQRDCDGYLRIYMGPSLNDHQEALERLRRAGIHYAMGQM